MSLPIATRCAMQALRESSDERAQNVYALMVQAFVSGAREDIKAAEEALEKKNNVRLETPSHGPEDCHSDEFRVLHTSALSTAQTCGVHLPETVLSEWKSSDVKTSVSYIIVICILILLCVVVHAWIQKCKPTHLCIFFFCNVFLSM